MKLLMLSILLISSSSFAQKEFKGDHNDGYRCIRKAKKHYGKGNFKKSLSFLDKADQMDYGFCGNAWMDASEGINSLRSMNYIKLGNYHLARNYLDSIISFTNPSKFDSLRWVSYQLEIGADSLSKIIDTSLENIVFVDSGFYQFIFIPLPVEEGFAKFTFNPRNYQKKGDMNDSIASRKEYWISEFKKSTLYFMIKEGS